MTYHSKQIEEALAKEEYLKVIKTLKQEGLGSWTGEWDDQVKPNKFGRDIISKGDKQKFLKYYQEEQKLLKDSLNLTVDNDDEDYDF